MRNKLRALKKSDKKGFTLVELIVVLVILAILAALLIPALTGYIDKAKEKSVTAECRQVVMAAQTLYDEAYGEATTGKVVFDGETATADDTKITNQQVADLAEVAVGNIKAITTGTVSGVGNKIKTVNYENKGIKVQYKDGTYSKVNSFT